LKNQKNKQSLNQDFQKILQENNKREARIMIENRQESLSFFLMGNRENIRTILMKIQALRDQISLRQKRKKRKR